MKKILQTLKLNNEWIVHRLPKRSKDANKGTFGKVLVIAGSENYPGAAYLCCAAAYRVGAGLVTLATQPSVKIIVSRKLPELTFLPLEEVYEKLSTMERWWEKLKEDCVLTPHPGEMARLTGLSVEKIQEDRVNVAKKFATKWKNRPK